ncbi:hypothetical protein TNIN_409221 [Trichonephila inaurata madagascariensis]|uniref:Uncharacterized protein n=1 Tax=Trichonephila inaurata madagascariensis TaxID=2747483 RepID=A0A8X7BQG6_9ARAC|nr:hypothetical protein TNIN_409221 [Trichonephila inaurata madagascariensis]
MCEGLDLQAQLAAASDRKVLIAKKKPRPTPKVHSKTILMFCGYGPGYNSWGGCPGYGGPYNGPGPQYGQPGYGYGYNYGGYGGPMGGPPPPNPPAPGTENFSGTGMAGPATTGPTATTNSNPPSQTGPSPPGEMFFLK